MTAGAILLWASLAAPVALLLACLSGRLRRHLPRLLALAPLPAMGAALAAAGGPPVEAKALLFGLVLAIDAPGAVLLGVAALLWSAVGAYAGAYLGDRPHAGRFSAFWLLTLTGSLGVFLAADLAGFYLAFALASLAAYGLVVHQETPRAHRAARIYLILAMLGEVCLLIGLMLACAATPDQSLLIRDVAAALPDSPRRNATIGFLVAGFGLKAGLVPLHVWLPLAHPAAPSPASAVLSGAIVKAGIVGLLRFLPGDAALPGWGEALATLGFATAFCGALVGVTQREAKTVLAYSTVSQMGLLVAVLGVALAAGRLAEAALPTAIFAAHHALAKGALFLAAGLVAASSGAGVGRLWWVLLPSAILGLGLGGLPLTGGMLAKLAIKDPLGEGLPAALATASAAATTLLMLHAMRCLIAVARGDGAGAVQAPTFGLVAPWAVVALGAWGVPGTLYLELGLGTVAQLFAPAALRDAAMPVLAGGMLALLLRGLDARGWIPAVPEGDIVVLAKTAAARLPLGLLRRLRARGRLPAWTHDSRGGASLLVRVDSTLRTWPAATLALLILAILLGLALMGTGHRTVGLPGNDTKARSLRLSCCAERSLAAGAVHAETRRHSRNAIG